MSLLELDSSACSFQLSLELFSLSLGNLLLKSLGSSLNSFLSFLKGKTNSVLNSLDNVHLSVAEGDENYVELGLFSLSGSACYGTCCCYDSGNTVLFLDSFNELCELKNRICVKFFKELGNLFRCHDNISFSKSI